MPGLADRIRDCALSPGQVAIFSLAQAGFCLKTSAGKAIFIDPYLTDCVERIAGFKRMIPTVMAPEEVEADLVLATHAHPDHLDEDALEVIARTGAFFIGAADCLEGFRRAGLPAGRFAVLREGERLQHAGVTVRAVAADHGTLAPEAVGFVLEVDGHTIYNAGDTGPAAAAILASLQAPVDVMIAPINGAYGNLDARQACELAALVCPKLLIGCHFWMFVEHGGDPAAFLEHAKQLLPGTTATVMAPGERLTIDPLGRGTNAE